MSRLKRFYIFLIFLRIKNYDYSILKDTRISNHESEEIKTNNH